jgi:ligand-binding sensor domain-containing protein
MYNDNNTIDNKTDDILKRYFTGENSGNLASNDVICLAIDKQGKVWVGTENGISIFNNPESASSDQGINAENKIVQYDIAAGKLFSGESIKAIAVDGGDRKWIGTYNGAWLISNDAEKIIKRFTTENSPLPSNEIQSIAINPNTGMVYFGTNKGIVAYKGESTEGALVDNAEPIVIPNPVSKDYTGNIAIKGLVDDAEVSIIDEAGQLVHKTTAYGGTAIWNGYTYDGQRPQSGVYYILATNKTGTLKQKTKLVLLN